MVYVFLAEGFEECEAIAPIDLMRRAGIEIVTVAVGGKENELLVSGAYKIKIAADIHESEILLDKIEMIVLPGGGTGVENLFKSATVKNAIRHCVRYSLPIGAICAAPSIPARMGLLSGKKAACYPAFEDILRRNGTTITGDKVITDGIYTTAAGAGVSIPFALECIRVLKGEKAAADIKRSIIA